MSKRTRESGSPPTDWESERTLEAAEVDAREARDGTSAEGETACTCGNRDLLLQGYFAVREGVLAREPLEVEGLTCPECGRAFEAVVLADGRISRGEFVGWAEVEDA
jgi:hypothetical protein